MKIALYIEDGLEQIVLTPESKQESDILGRIHDGSRSIELRRGDFYECRGGWVRWKQPQSGMFSHGDSRNHDESTMIVLRERAVEETQLPEEDEAATLAQGHAA